MDIKMDVSMESSIGSWCLSPEETPERKMSFNTRSKIISSAEDSGYSSYSSSSHGSEPRPEPHKTNWKQRELLRSPNKFYWGRIMPERLTTPSNSFVGEKHLDLIVKLCNYPHILQKVLSELQPDDLVRCCLVSKLWNKICKFDTKSSHRRKAYLSSKGLKNKENLGLPDECKINITVVPRIFTSTPLTSIASSRQYNFCVPPPSIRLSPVTAASPAPTTDRFSLFVSAGLKLTPGKTQMPCPRCSLPSRVDRDIHVGQCSQPQCRFQFCLICLCEQHIDSRCPVSQLSSVQCKWPRSLTSKSCRRTLRRL